MFQYLMVYFVQKYVNPEYMGQDAVFVHLFDKYINSGETEFFTEKYRKYLNDRAYSIMANLIGEPAANLEMVDSNGALRPLYGVNANYIIVCFWDPTCSHCKEVVPRLDSMYKAKWKQEGIKIYGVMVDGGREAWIQFIKDHNLSDWTHVYETKNTGRDGKSWSSPDSASCTMCIRPRPSTCWIKTNALSQKTF